MVWLVALQWRGKHHDRYVCKTDTARGNCTSARSGRWQCAPKQQLEREREHRVGRSIANKALVGVSVHTARVRGSRERATHKLLLVGRRSLTRHRLLGWSRLLTQRDRERHKHLPSTR